MANGHHIVVLGGGYAGLTAAARIAEAQSGARVTLVDRKASFVERIRLHQVAAGSEPCDLGYSTFMQNRGGAFLRSNVSEIDLNQQHLEIEGQGGLDWDTLIYALGSFTNVDSVDGVTEYAVTLDEVEECQQLYQWLKIAAPKTKIMVVGGGLTAIETACEFAERLPGLGWARRSTT